MAGALGVASIAAPAALADQPAMQRALDNLEQARQNLQNATEDKGGHRRKALNLVNQAIAQVQAGIRFDRRN